MDGARCDLRHVVDRRDVGLAHFPYLVDQVPSDAIGKSFAHSGRRLISAPMSFDLVFASSSGTSRTVSSWTLSTQLAEVGFFNPQGRFDQNISGH